MTPGITFFLWLVTGYSKTDAYIYYWKYLTLGKKRNLINAIAITFMKEYK